MESRPGTSPVPAGLASRSGRAVRLPGVTTDAVKRPFEQVVARYGPMVLRVCRVVLGPDEAEDAWSETFLAALKAYPRLPGDANVEAWLVTIAHRKAIDAVRSAARRPLAADPLPDRPARGGGPEDRDLDLDLWAAVAALPQRQRTAVAYHYLAGLPYAQVAEITGGSADAARRAAADGIAALRASYGSGGRNQDGARGERKR
jgi:RNA polymerase sigma factor (sigma-70 family)